VFDLLIALEYDSGYVGAVLNVARVFQFVAVEMCTHLMSTHAAA
jgi:hypothetical protein